MYPVHGQFDVFCWSNALAPSTLPLLAESLHTQVSVMPSVLYDSARDRWILSSSDGGKCRLHVPVGASWTTCTIEVRLDQYVLPKKLNRQEYVGVALAAQGCPSCGVLLSQEGFGIVRNMNVEDIEKVPHSAGLLADGAVTLRLAVSPTEAGLYVMSAGGGFDLVASWVPHPGSGSPCAIIELAAAPGAVVAANMHRLCMGLEVETSTSPTAVISTSTSKARVGDVVMASALRSINPTGQALTYSWTYTPPSGSTSELSGGQRASVSFGALTATAAAQGYVGNSLRVRVVEPSAPGPVTVSIDGLDVTLMLGMPTQGVLSSTTEVVDTLNNPLHPAYNAAVADVVAWSGSSDEPPSLSGYVHMSGGVSSTEPSAIFIPDVPGHYTLGLQVDAGGMLSEQVVATVAVEHSSLVYGVRPDASMLRRQVAQPFFNMLGNSDVIVSAWSGVLSVAADLLLDIEQTKLNAHAWLAPRRLRRKWSSISMRESIAESVIDAPSAALANGATLVFPGAPVDDDDGNTTTRILDCPNDISAYYSSRIGSHAPSYTAVLVGPGHNGTVVCSDSVACAELIGYGKYGRTAYDLDQTGHVVANKHTAITGDARPGDRFYADGVYNTIVAASTNALQLSATSALPYPTEWRIFRSTVAPHTLHVLMSTAIPSAVNVAVGDLVCVLARPKQAASGLSDLAGKATVLGIADGRMWLSCADFLASVATHTLSVSSTNNAGGFALSTNLSKAAADASVIRCPRVSSAWHNIVDHTVSPDGYVTLGIDGDTLSWGAGDTLEVAPKGAAALSSYALYATGVVHTSTVVLPPDVVSVPVLRSSLLVDDMCLVLNEDYTLEGGTLHFVLPYSLRRLPPDTLWAEHVLVHNRPFVDAVTSAIGAGHGHELAELDHGVDAAKVLARLVSRGPTKGRLADVLSIASGSKPLAEDAMLLDYTSGVGAMAYIRGGSFTGSLDSVVSDKTLSADSVGSIFKANTVIDPAVSVEDYLDGSGTAEHIMRSSLATNALDVRHAFIARRRATYGMASVLANRLIRTAKPAWQRGALVAVCGPGDELLDVSERVVLKRLMRVVDVPFSIEDTGSPLVMGGVPVFGGNRRFYAAPIELTLAGCTDHSATVPEGLALHAGYVMVSQNDASRYAWVTGYSGSRVAYDFGVVNGPFSDGEVVTVAPGGACVAGLRFTQLRRGELVSGTDISATLPQDIVDHVTPEINWRMHNVTKGSWGLVISVVGATIELGMESELGGPGAANGSGDVVELLPPSGYPVDVISPSAILHLGPMEHPDFRVILAEESDEFGLGSVVQAHTEYVDAESVVPPNYPVDARSRGRPLPTLSDQPEVSEGMVTLHGNWFGSDLVVSIGGVAAVCLPWTSTQVTAMLPEGVQGSLDVAVSSGYGQGTVWPDAIYVSEPI